MPLNPTPTGTAIAAAIKASAPGPGVEITDAQLITMWIQVVTIIYADLAANALVAPGTFNVAGIGPVVGVGGPIT